MSDDQSTGYTEYLSEWAERLGVAYRAVVVPVSGRVDHILVIGEFHLVFCEAREVAGWLRGVTQAGEKQFIYDPATSKIIAHPDYMKVVTAAYPQVEVAKGFELVGFSVVSEQQLVNERCRIKAPEVSVETPIDKPAL